MATAPMVFPVAGKRLPDKVRVEGAAGAMVWGCTLLRVGTCTVREPGAGCRAATPENCRHTVEVDGELLLALAVREKDREVAELLMEGVRLEVVREPETDPEQLVPEMMDTLLTACRDVDPEMVTVCTVPAVMVLGVNPDIVGVTLLCTVSAPLVS